MNKQQLESRLSRLSIMLGDKLKRKNWRIACAESCTGGLLAKAITDVIGSSAYFEQGIIAYSNESKQNMLGVEPELFIQHGAVSEPVVNKMAIGMLERADVDLVVAISGITGPGGGTPEKPVGTVWFSWMTKEGLDCSQCNHFSGNRETIRLQTAIFATEMLLTDFI